MSIVSLPNTTFDLTVAPQLIENSAQRVLFMGQQATDASPKEVLVSDIQVDQSPSLFGARSMLTTMIQAFRNINTITAIDAIPFNDAGGATAATATVDFGSTTATANGTIFIPLQSEFFYTYQVPVATGDTSAAVAANFVSQVNITPTIGVTATNNLDGSVTLVAFNAGTEGNDLSIRIENDGITGIPTTLTGFAGGATDPTFTSAIFDQVGDRRYTRLVYPSSFDAAVIAQFLDNRFNPTNAVRDGVGVTQITNTSPGLQSAADALNSQSMVILGNKPVALSDYTGGAILEYNPTVASYWAALSTLRLTLGQNIPNLLIGPLTATNPVGGPRVAAIPYFNTPVSLIDPIDLALGWTSAQQNALNTAGVSFLGNNIANNEVILGQMVTTYVKNSQGLPDTAFKFLNTVDTGSQIREFFFNNNKNEYAQAVLTTGDVVASYQVNVQAFNAFQLNLYTVLSEPPYSLTVAGTNAINFFKSNITTTLNEETGTISTVMIVPIVSQLRNINGVIEIAFDVVTA